MELELDKGVAGLFDFLFIFLRFHLRFVLWRGLEVKEEGKV